MANSALTLGVGTQGATGAAGTSDGSGYLAKAGGTGGTLTPTESANGNIEFNTAITSNIVWNVFDTTRRHWRVYNNTTGGFTVTLKTPAGTGVPVVSGIPALLESDGTNVVAIPTGGAGGSGTFKTLRFENVPSSAQYSVNAGSTTALIQAGYSNSQIQTAIASLPELAGRTVIVRGALQYIASADVWNGSLSVFVSGADVSVVVGAGEVQRLVVAAGDAGNYTLNGGATFQMGVSAATLQANQRTLGGSYAAVNVTGSGTTVTAQVDFTEGLPGTSITASSIASGLYPPPATIDNNTSTFWVSSGIDVPWLQIDLGLSRAILNYTITTGTDQQPVGWTFLGSSTGTFGGEETTMDTQTSLSLSVSTKYTYTATGTFRYVRWQMNGAAANRKFTELEVIGSGVNDGVADYKTYFPVSAGNVAAPSATGTGVTASTIYNGGDAPAELTTFNGEYTPAIIDSILVGADGNPLSWNGQILTN